MEGISRLSQLQHLRIQDLTSQRLLHSLVRSLPPSLQRLELPGSESLLYEKDETPSDIEVQLEGGLFTSFEAIMDANVGWGHLARLACTMAPKCYDAQGQLRLKEVFLSGVSINHDDTPDAWQLQQLRGLLRGCPQVQACEVSVSRSVPKEAVMDALTLLRGTRQSLCLALYRGSPRLCVVRNQEQHGSTARQEQPPQTLPAARPPWGRAPAAGLAPRPASPALADLALEHMVAAWCSLPNGALSGGAGMSTSATPVERASAAEAAPTVEAAAGEEPAGPGPATEAAATAEGIATAHTAAGGCTWVAGRRGAGGGGGARVSHIATQPAATDDAVATAQLLAATPGSPAVADPPAVADESVAVPAVLAAVAGPAAATEQAAAAEVPAATDASAVAVAPLAAIEMPGVPGPIIGDQLPSGTPAAADPDGQEAAADPDGEEGAALEGPGPWPRLLLLRGPLVAALAADPEALRDFMWQQATAAADHAEAAGLGSATGELQEYCRSIKSGVYEYMALPISPNVAATGAVLVQCATAAGQAALVAAAAATAAEAEAAVPEVGGVAGEQGGGGEPPPLEALPMDVWNRTRYSHSCSDFLSTALEKAAQRVLAGRGPGARWSEAQRVRWLLGQWEALRGLRGPRLVQPAAEQPGQAQ